MTEVTPTSIDRVVVDLLAYDPEEIILFGSAARGDTTESSDIDFIVIKKTDRRFVERLVDVKAFLPKDISVDTFVYTPQEFEAMIEAGNPFMEQALGDGKIVYERSSGIHQAEAAPPTKWSFKGGIPFVSRPLETARHWLVQAERNLAMARTLLDAGFWSGVCFQAEQTAQMGLKAFLYLRGHRPIFTHAVTELAQQCVEEDTEFQVFLDQSGEIGEYYISTRYPDAVTPPAVPFEMFTEQEAQVALKYAKAIVDIVRAKIEAAAGDCPEPTVAEEDV